MHLNNQYSQYILTKKKKTPNTYVFANITKFKQSLHYYIFNQTISTCRHNTTYLPICISNVRTVPSTLPPKISFFVKQTDITLSEK